MKLLRMSKAEAELRSYGEAHARGCTGVTEYWWASCDQGLLINEDDLSGLTEEELLQLESYTFPEEV